MVYDREAFNTELIPLVEKFYKEKFWDSVSADSLPSGIDVYLALAAVNLGAKTACKLLQGTLGVEQDGVLGVKTLAALKSFSGGLDGLLKRLMERHKDYYIDKKNPKFEKGWLDRCDLSYEFCKTLLE